MGKFVAEFERNFAQYIGVKKAISTSSCTSALETIFNSINFIYCFVFLKFTMTEETPNTNNENDAPASDSSSDESPANPSVSSVDSSTSEKTSNVDESSAAKSTDDKESSVDNKSNDAKPESKPPKSAKTGTRPPPKSLSDIFIGKKPVMSYAMSAMIQLTQNGSVTVKARGMVISLSLIHI